MLWSYVYVAIGNFGSSAFFAQSVQPTSADFLYFSFITQLTVGYGDLTAAGNLGRACAVIEALDRSDLWATRSCSDLSGGRGSGVPGRDRGWERLVRRFRSGLVRGRMVVDRRDGRGRRRGRIFALLTNSPGRSPGWSPTSRVRTSRPARPRTRCGLSRVTDRRRQPRTGASTRLDGRWCRHVAGPPEGARRGRR